MPGISFDRAAEYYDATRGYLEGVPELIRDAIVKYTGADNSSRFLELGVGTGRIALPFIQAGYDFTGVDISQAMMQRLEAKLAADPRRTEYRYWLEQADIMHLPFPDETFDVALAVHVLHLVENWRQVIQETRRVLRKPSGWLLIAQDEPVEQAPETLPLPTQVRHKWLQILAELGLDVSKRRPARWAANQEIVAYLQELGAAVKVEYLAEYNWPPLSTRQTAERLKARLYSSDWKTPDDIHAAAAQRLDEWINHEVPNPDEAISNPGRFKAVVARF